MLSRLRKKKKNQSIPDPLVPPPRPDPTLTWQASTPPSRKPLQSILEVSWPSVTSLHTVSLMIFTEAFCSICDF